MSPPLRYKLIEENVEFICDASGCGERFGPDEAFEKAGERPDFRRWHFAVVRLEREKAK